MDKFFFRGKETNAHVSGIFSGLHIFQGILIWLADLIRLTEKEQQEAGIILGDQRYR